MSLVIKSLVFIAMLMIPFSGVVCGDEFRMPSDLANVYGYNEGRSNLFIGGIGQETPGPDTNKDCKTFADQIGAIYIPTYYSEEWKKWGITFGDIPQVNAAASSDAFYWATSENGLTNTLLKGDQNDPIVYDTIIAHSGGTVTAVTALDKQYVICNTLMLISPIIGVVPEELSEGYPGAGIEKANYKAQLNRLLRQKKVQRIVIIECKDDITPLGDYYQAKLERGKDLDSRIKVHNIDKKAIYGRADTGEHASIDVHKDLFRIYAMDNIKLDNDGRVYCNPPEVQGFQVMSLSTIAGESFKIDYTVVSDNDYSGLKQVELWRENEKSNWQMVKKYTLSGNDYSHSGSFTDSPPCPGKYWYGLHIVDNDDNWNDEQNSNTKNPSVSFKPEEIEVSSSPRSIVGEWTLHSREASKLVPTDSLIAFYDDYTLHDSSYGSGHWSQIGNTVQWEYDNCGNGICTSDKTTYKGTIDFGMKGMMQTCDGEKGDWSADKRIDEPGIRI